MWYFKVILAKSEMLCLFKIILDPYVTWVILGGGYIIIATLFFSFICKSEMFQEK